MSAFLLLGDALAGLVGISAAIEDGLREGAAKATAKSLSC